MMAWWPVLFEIPAQLPTGGFDLQSNYARRPGMNKGLICGFVLFASLAWGQQSTASTTANKDSVEQNGNIDFSVKLQPSPSTTSTVKVVVLPEAGGQAYSSLCTVHRNEDTCNVTVHVPSDAATGKWKIAAVKIAPIGAVYKDLKLEGDAPAFDVTKNSVVLPDSAQVVVKQ
jgi:hypothetical protein